eukprot:m.51271 g.51271  ORF g.51271 m.51271 type:complete len:281 (-) comp7555_c0_seq1:200-1042(-)
MSNCAFTTHSTVSYSYQTVTQPGITSLSLSSIQGGSFKIRGAANAVKMLDPECKDVVTHSSGNHGQALTLAATMLGIKAHIVVPDNAPAVKKAAMEDYGADIIMCESTQQAREKTAQETIDRIPHSVFIPPYDFPAVIAGQGTLGLEILDQLEDVDAIIVPVGGGGMLSGIALGVKNKNPKVKVIGAEPDLADDCYRSFQAKERLGNPSYPQTVADGVRVDIGKLTWPIVRDFVDAVFTVSEKEIVQGWQLFGVLSCWMFCQFDTCLVVSLLTFSAAICT